MKVILMNSYIIILSFVRRYAGPMVPLIGNTFWYNELGIWIGSFIPCILSITIVLFLHFFQHQVEFPSISSENLMRKQQSYSLKQQHTTRSLLFFSVLISWTLMVLCLYLPSLRLRVYYYSQRGSRFTTSRFTVTTFNIQVGYSLPNAENAGFPATFRTAELDVDIKPNIWGLQESSATNLLTMNRDWVSYLGDAMHLHTFHGAPSRIPSPGVALLTTEKLLNPTYEILPRGGEPLARLVSWGIYPWKEFSYSQDSTKILVAVTHLSAFNEEARQLQLTRLKNLIESVWDQYPIVLMGDFNNNPSNTTEIWNNTVTTLPVGKLRRVTADGPTVAVPPDNIDHIYYKGLCLKRYGISTSYGISDHVPVWAQFSLPAEDGSCT